MPVKVVGCVLKRGVFEADKSYCMEGGVCWLVYTYIEYIRTRRGDHIHSDKLLQAQKSRELAIGLRKMGWGYKRNKDRMAHGKKNKC
jgi:hypothetical protein